MLNKIFNPDNRFFQFIAKLTDLVGLSLAFIFLSLPLFTVGATTMALYAATVRGLRFQEFDSVYLVFWQTFKTNFKRGGILTIIWAVIGWWLIYAYYYLKVMATFNNQFATVIFVAFGFLVIIPAGICFWQLLINSRYEHSLLALTGLAFHVTMRHFVSTLVMVLIVAEVISLCYQHFYLVLFMPATVVYFLSYRIEKIFARYTDK